MLIDPCSRLTEAVGLQKISKRKKETLWLNKQVTFLYKRFA